MTDTSTADFFSSLSHKLSDRAARATLSQMGVRHPALRAYLAAKLSAPPGEPTSLVADPVFENMFEWESGDKPLRELSFLHPDLIENLEQGPGDGIEGLFPDGRLPYKHQLKAWRALCEPPRRSVLVRTGTSSGKTEAFLVPILNDLTRELAERGGERLVGVRALFLYPLNALINSQKERLLAGTGRYGDRMAFCLYNGNTEERMPPAEAVKKSEIMSRQRLRECPPPILVTNATMLEYMLVRRVDEPILSKSQGHLRWIVLDEAHTYLGSAAAELALLLRRVLHAFGADRDKVRFVATSATIGGPEEADKLGGFLADLAGVSSEQVEVVSGQRLVPKIPKRFAKRAAALPALDALRSMEDGKRAEALLSSKEFQRVRAMLGKQPASLAQLVACLDKPDRARCLALLDLASARGVKLGKSPVLPLRGHYFQRTQTGIWCCTNRDCGGKAGTELEGAEWPFGNVLLQPRQTCPDCSAKVGELVLCQRCGEAYIHAVEKHKGLCFDPWPSGDGFAIDEVEDPLGEDIEEDEAVNVDDAARQLLAGPEGARLEDGQSVRPHAYEPFEGVIGRGEAQVYFASKKNGRWRCGHCGNLHKAHQRIFRAARLGVPFYLRNAIPTLAEHLPEEERGAAALPGRGRRLITFTDSRQGTARHALQLQLESERVWTRATIYHQLWDLRRVARKTPKQLELEKALTENRSMLDAIPNHPVILARIAELEKEIASQSAEYSMSWNDMLKHLAGELTVREFMRDGLDSQYAPAKLQPAQLAELCLWREFLRPSSHLSLETLGLAALTYPALAESVRVAPTAWASAGGSVEEWIEFLAFCLDFFVRSRNAIDLEPDIARWMGSPCHMTRIVEPTETAGERQVAFPTGGQGYLATTLVTALDMDLGSPDRGILRALLERAWEDLYQSPYLRRTEQGYRLSMAEVSLVPCADIWRCPITGRVLRHTVRGFAPYGVDRPAVRKRPCEKHALPVPPAGYPKGDPEFERWLQTDSTVQAARETGLWTEFCDRIARFNSVTYLRNAEHSAQVDKGALARFEKAFRQGRVNVLHCSTTMEMGVDIGGLSGVMMNNVPPGPANYLQRAGRAGRRGETRAAVVTVCPATAHGGAVFRNPLWPFESVVRAPEVSLSSERIVQRHVNSLLLGCFLRGVDEKVALSMKCRDFFGIEEAEEESSLLGRFMTWLLAVPGNAEVEEGLRLLITRTKLEGRLQERLEVTLSNLTEISARWRAERDALLEQLQAFGSETATDWKNMTPPQRALTVQLSRQDGDFTLRYLATQGFLPAYGFPLSVLPLVTTTWEELKWERGAPKEEGGESPSTGRRSYPSRSLARALMEYVPGQEIVVNGVVRRSEGVTLNWQIPATDEGLAPEPQSLKYFVRCKRCGDRRSSVTRPRRCAILSCGAPEEELRWSRYLEPAGFAVNFFDRPANAGRSGQRLASPEPLITAGKAEWQPFPCTSAGSYRAHADGTVFVYSRGQNGAGYVVCHFCGYATSMKGKAGDLPHGQIPDAFTDHFRLRGGKRNSAEERCPGASAGNGHWSGIFFGGENYTDVFELALSETGGDRGSVVATSLAVALREALAKRLGVDHRELGWFVSEGKAIHANKKLIAIYDTADGGAGYATQAVDDLHQLFLAAERVLDCPKSCDAACHSCLLSFDTDSYSEKLNRHDALQALRKVLMSGFELPDELRAFGEQTTFEPQQLFEAFVRFDQYNPVDQVRVYWDAQVQDWDLPAWRMWSKLAYLKGRREGQDDVKVEVVIPAAAASELNWQEAEQLSEALRGAQFTLRIAEPTALNGNGLVLALEAGSSGKVRRWAVSDTSALCPSETWGSGENENLVCVREDSAEWAPLAGQVQDPSVLRKARPGAVDMWELVVPEGTRVAAFGAWIHKSLLSQKGEATGVLPTGVPLVQVDYSDRYLRSPLTGRLLYELLQQLSHYGLSRSTAIKVDTVRSDNYPKSSFAADWSERQTHADVLQGLIGTLSQEVLVNVHSDRNSVSHDRKLNLRWENGQGRTIWFDQGVGFVRVRHTAYDHGARVTEQVKALRNADARVIGGTATRVWVWVH